MAISEETRAELREQHGDKAVLVDNDVGTFVFAKPKAIHWSRYVKALTSDDKRRDKVADMAQLCRDCLVYPTGVDGRPDQSKLALLFEEYPAISATVCGDLSDLAGAGESHAGKL